MHSRQAPYPELYLQACDPDWSLVFLPGLGATAGLPFLEQSCPVSGALPGLHWLEFLSSQPSSTETILPTIPHGPQSLKVIKSGSIPVPFHT